jgi:spermidine/putrescine transport system substrate-binding protein
MPVNDDEMLRQAVEMSRQLSRRRFLRGTGAAFGAAALGGSLLSACGSSDASGSSGSGSGSGGGKNLTISTWDAYIDVDKGGNANYKGGSIDTFENQTGIDVTYKTDFNDNDEYFNKYFEPYLGKNKPLGADIVVPTYWLAARLVGLKWLEALPLDKIPNHKNVDPAYTTVSWDEGGKHQMPWQAGITGIAYDPDLTGRDLTSFKDLLDPAFKGKVGMLTEMRDTVGLAMLSQGKDVTKVDMDGADAALDLIQQAKDDGQVRAFTGNEYLTSLESGDFVACMAWSGDIVQLQQTKPNIKFVIPDEGGMQWFDTMVIPILTKNVDSAAAWMNFVYDPVNAAKITAYVQYIPPCMGVKDELLKMGGDNAKLADSPILFPDDATKERLKIFADLTSAEEIKIQNRFNKITGG